MTAATRPTIPAVPRPRARPATMLPPPPVAAPVMPAAARERIAGPWRWLPIAIGWVRRITRPATPGESAPGAGTSARIPYMDRYSLRQQGPSGQNPWRVYVNHFLAPDSEGHHNHPSAWSFSIVLWGSYTEEVLERRCGVWHRFDGDHCQGECGSPSLSVSVRRRRVRWFNWIAADRYHRIAELHPGPGARGVWTLFVCGPLTGRGWGFYVAGKGHVSADTPR